MQGATYQIGFIAKHSGQFVNFACRATRLFSQFSYLICYNSETPTQIAGPGGLNGRIEGQQVGLVCDIFYLLGHFGN